MKKLHLTTLSSNLYMLLKEKIYPPVIHWFPIMIFIHDRKVLITKRIWQFNSLNLSQYGQYLAHQPLIESDQVLKPTG